MTTSLPSDADASKVSSSGVSYSHSNCKSDSSKGIILFSSTGLGKKASQPAIRLLSWSISKTLADTATIGIFFALTWGNWLMACTASKPVMVGIIKSVKIKSGNCSSTFVTNSLPSLTGTTLKPSGSNRLTITSRFSNLSSAT